MNKELIIEYMPQLKDPTLVLGFDGWANGGNLAVGLMDYLVKMLGATKFARFNVDNFYRFDDTRPTVKVEGGRLKEILPPEAAFYAVRNKEGGKDFVFFKGNEPHLQWASFVNAMLSLCKYLGVSLIVSIGGLQDNVVHTDAIISGLASSQDLLDRLKRANVIPIDYEGPGAIHSLILEQGKAAGIEGASLWGHCPFYLQGTHLRLLSQMSKVLTQLTGLHIDTEALDRRWVQLAREIQQFVDNNPELQKVIKEIMKSKMPSEPSPRRMKTNGNVIYLDNFFRSKG